MSGRRTPDQGSKHQWTAANVELKQPHRLLLEAHMEDEKLKRKDGKEWKRKGRKGRGGEGGRGEEELKG
ncbi:hypothetical protein ElyMa_006176600 [Elysia marginata]|uniref:Uncharacterized protein n=1 Tax=Elysia marginata TaxID=1093978 RepID=A0AAV4H0C6_9GAST|nr:hypothetical protein ElyMa_006176600 [Elysia marginata]